MKLYSKLPRIDEAKVPLFDIKKGIEVEPEFGALLYGLVRMLKPTVCVETGTYIGDSTWWIAKGIGENGKGSLVSCDTSDEYVQNAKTRFVDSHWVKILKQDGRELLLSFPQMDFVFLDGGDPPQRLEQLKVIGDHNISPGGIVAWHDAVIWCPDMYEHFASTHDWPHLILPTPVGVAVFQRPEA